MTNIIDVETDRAAVRQAFSLQVERPCNLDHIRAAISGLQPLPTYDSFALA